MRPEERQALLIKRNSEFERVTFDTRIKAGETQKFKFVYKENPDNIEGYKIHCKTCTEVQRNGGVFEVTFKAPPRSDYMTQIKNGDTSSQYTSSISVYFKDGQPVSFFNDKGELKDNPDKIIVSLQIRTVIEFA